MQSSWSSWEEGQEEHFDWFFRDQSIEQLGDDNITLVLDVLYALPRRFIYPHPTRRSIEAVLFIRDWKGCEVARVRNLLLDERLSGTP